MTRIKKKKYQYDQSALNVHAFSNFGYFRVSKPVKTAGLIFDSYVKEILTLKIANYFKKIIIIIYF